MARPGITALIPSFGEDVVAIFKKNAADEDVQILEDAHLMQASIGEDVSAFQHPLENGRIRVDHRIIQPVTIELRVILTDKASIIGAALRESLDFKTAARDTYRDLRELFLAGTSLSVQTRANTYPNQLINSMPHDETPALFNGLIISLSMSELLIETSNKAFGPAEAKDSDTQARGIQRAAALPTGFADVASIFGI